MLGFFTSEKEMWIWWGILKIDIEGCEWHWLKNLGDNEVNRFDQIIIEFHDLHNTEKQEFYAECLKKINNNFL